MKNYKSLIYKLLSLSDLPNVQVATPSLYLNKYLTAPLNAGEIFTSHWSVFIPNGVLSVCGLIAGSLIKDVANGGVMIMAIIAIIAVLWGVTILRYKLVRIIVSNHGVLIRNSIIDPKPQVVNAREIVRGDLVKNWLSPIVDTGGIAIWTKEGKQIIIYDIASASRAVMLINRKQSLSSG